MVCIKGEKDVQFNGKTGMEQFIDVDDEIPGCIGGVSRWSISLAIGNLIFKILVIPIVSIAKVAEVMSILPIRARSFILTCKSFLGDLSPIDPHAG